MNIPEARLEEPAEPPPKLILQLLLKQSIALRLLNKNDEVSQDQSKPIKIENTLAIGNVQLLREDDDETTRWNRGRPVWFDFFDYDDGDYDPVWAHQ